MGYREAKVIPELHLKQSGLGKCLKDFCERQETVHGLHGMSRSMPRGRPMAERRWSWQNPGYKMEPGLIVVLLQQMVHPVHQVQMPHSHRHLSHVHLKKGLASS